MDRFYYVKVMLYAYPKLETLAEAVSDSAQVKAMLSFRAAESALATAERIAEEISTANRLRFLKQDLDEILGSLDEEAQFLLEYKYFRRKSELSGRFAGRALACSERSYFRKQNALLSTVAAALCKRGRTQRQFFEQFGGYAPFMRVYRALCGGRESAVVFKRRRRTLSFGQKSETS